MKKLIFIIALTNAMVLSAQEADSLGLAYQDIPFQEANPCAGALVQAEAVIRYDDSAIGFIKINGHVEAGLNQAYLLTQNGLLLQQQPINDDGTVVFYRLELDKNYTITTVNACGENLSLTDISTKEIPKSSPFIASDDMLNLLSNWSSQSEVPNLYDLLVTPNNLVHYYERLAFMQYYIFNRKTLNPSLRLFENSFPIKPTEEEYKAGIEDSCKCVFVIAHYRECLPNNGMTYGYIVGLQYPVLNPPNKVSNVYPKIYATQSESFGSGSSDYQWREQHTYQGPARQENVWTTGRYFQGRNYPYTTTQNANNANAYNRAQITWFYMCSNYSMLPSNCACDNVVDVAYGYHSKINVSAELVNCLFCGSRNAYVNVEDHAVLTLSDNQGNVDIVANGQAGAKAYCNRNWNRQFWIEAADMVGPLTSIILAATGVTQNPNWVTTLSQFATALEGVIETPFYTDAGCDPDENTSGDIIGGHYSFILHANIPTYLTMSSFGRIDAGGATQWNARGHIKSGFYLSSVLRNNALNTDLEYPYCCTPTVAQWIRANQTGDPNYDNTTLQAISNHIDLYDLTNYDNYPRRPDGFFAIRQNMGIILDKSSCSVRPNKSLINDEVAIQIINTPNSWEVINNSNEVCNYKILSIDGKQLSEGLLNAGHNTIDIDMNWTSGIYFLNYTSPKGTNTLTLSKPQ